MRRAQLGKTLSVKKSCGEFSTSNNRQIQVASGCAPYSLAEVDGLGIDSDGRLHWNGKPVEIIGRRLDLTWSQAVFGFLVAVFTVVGGIGAAAQGWAAYHDWACRNKRFSIMSCLATVDVPTRPENPRSD